MRRTRFQQGSLTTRKRKGRVYWLAQWREEGGHRTKELGLCSKVSSHAAKIMLQEILKPINARAEHQQIRTATFEQFVENVYIPIFQGGKWKDSTADNEISQIRHHLVGAFGDEMLRSITDEALQAFLNETGKSCGQSVLDHLRFRLRSIFKLAIVRGIVDRNPAEVLFRPRKYKPCREKKVLNPSDLFAMLEALDVREQLITRLATWEGMRPGEVLAIRIGDVELAEDCIWIRRRVYKGKLGDPKSDRSKRQAAVTLGTKALLKSWMERCCNAAPEAWLFPSEKGTPLRRDNVWRRYMLPKLEPIGLEWATFQVMRRTWATWSKKVGVDAHTRSAQMGNTVDVNENEYAVASFEAKLEAVRLLETAILQNGAGSAR
jgi:integrase